MRATAVLLLFFAIAGTPAFAQKVFIDYDREYDKKIETFAWKKTSETSLEVENGLLHSRIVNGIEHYLSQQGYTEVAENPDVYVTYHTSTASELSVDTSHYGYGYPGGWAWDPYYAGYWGGMGMSSSTTTVREYERGTLVVDVWDAETQKLVWRGTASVIVAENPQKLGRQVDRVLAKMVKQWQRIKARDSKARGG